MKLIKLSAYNFMPYKGEMVLNFASEEHRNITVIFGNNMRGKTSILNAIRWVFYGEAVARHSRPILLNDIVNIDSALAGDWKVAVNVQFEANGHTYDLRREAVPKKFVTTPSKPEDFSQTINMTRDGDVMRGDQVEDEIGRIIPKQISRFFLFDGELLEEYEALLYDDSQQCERIKEAIEQVLGVPTLTNGRFDIQNILKKARQEQNAEFKQEETLEKHVSDNARLMEEIDLHDIDIKSLEDKLVNLQDDCDSLEDELKKVQPVVSIDEKLKEREKERARLNEECKEKESQKLEIISMAWQDMIESQVLLKLKGLRNKREELVNAIEQRGALGQKIDDLKKSLDERKCLICGQRMDGKQRFQVSKSIKEIQSTLRQLEDSTAVWEETSAQIDVLSKIKGINAKDSLRLLERDLQKRNIRLTQVENDIEKFKGDIRGYDTSDITRKKLRRDRLVAEKGKLQRDIQVKYDERELLKGHLAVSQKAIEFLTKNNMQKSTRKVSVCSNLEMIFSQSIDCLRDRLRERVEKLSSDAFAEMTTQKDYQGLLINKNYGLHIVDVSGQRVAERSAGAEQIVALSLIDGLNRTSRAIGPVIMDTPFGRLDENHRNNILKYFPSVASQLVLLVHSGEIRRETDLKVIASKIGVVYDIEGISTTQSRLEETKL